LPAREESIVRVPIEAIDRVSVEEIQRIVQALQERQLELDLRNEALRESEERYRRIVDTADEGVWTIDAEANTDFVNPKMAQMLGYKVEEMLGRPLADFMDEEGQATAAANVKRREQGIAEQHEFKFRRKDGSDLWTSISTNPITDPRGAYKGALAMITDITVRKKAEEERATTLALLERAGQIAKVGAWGIDLRTMEHFWSRETFRILEVDSDIVPPVEEGINFYAPEARSVIRAAVQAGIESGTPYDLELPVITAKGRRIWVRAQGSPVMEDGKAVKLLGAFHDITERKQAEGELARMTALLMRTGELAKVGGWELDVRTRRLSWSLETCRIHETDSQVAPTVEQAIEFYPAEVRPPIQAAIQAGIDHGTPYDLELPLITAKGRHIWVRSQGSAVLEDGQPIKLIGAFQEITERKRAEEALADSQAALLLANETLQRSNDELEGRVAERTAQLRALTAELTHAEERVRLRVAESLHEGLSQLLSAALMHLATLEPHLTTGAAPQRLSDLKSCLDESINVCRNLTYELSPPILQSLGLGAALEWLGTWYHKKHGLSVEVVSTRGIDVPEKELRITLFRAAGELLFNVLKHAQVPRAFVQFRRKPCGVLHLEVSDMGVGFDPAAVKAREGSTGSFGLFSLRERIEARGGRFAIRSGPGKGSRITITVPALLPAVSAPPRASTRPKPRPGGAR